MTVKCNGEFMTKEGMRMESDEATSHYHAQGMYV